ncbi:hypothetical protein HNY42_01805 [Exiguobacterium sp. Helios]|jgi:protein arginine kinase activator|uniref:hypothetical protein n=1 Tax=unclassified Exiguobacterium TaxID=2644629 RepID=UPI000DF85DAD|nr:MULTISPECIES: hypothetical protein [unclassified Exiguobacterium]QNR19736.1 hypothetical protein HNY42_01805 [Exiguobacterium sp. Helios]RDB32106.1 hypothetical protein DVG79_14495 [Exiguobacterium sp. RIT594]
MRCQRCGEREAVVRVKLPQDQEGTEQVLCSVCVKELAKAYQETACPSCGMTRQQLLHLRKVGCATCYSFFKEEVDGMIRQFQHGHTKHYGSRPEEESVEKRLAQQLSRLKEQLNRKILSEDYEEAELIKQQIVNVEEDLRHV